MQLSFESLLKLAGGSQEDDLSKYLGLGLSEQIKSAIERKRKHEQELVAEEVAEEVLKLLKKSQTDIDDSVTIIRRLRAEESARLAHIKGIERAKAYAVETNNFLPLANILGLLSLKSVTTLSNKEILKVPDSWQPNKAEAQAQGTNK